MAKDQANHSTNSLLSSNLVEQENRFRSLFQVTTAASTDFKSQLQDVLHTSAQHLKLNMGVVSQIDQTKGTYTIYSVYPEDKGIKQGLVMPLQHTYCRIALEQGKIMAVSPTSESAIAQESCFKIWPLEAYIGTAVYVNDVFFGTICFANRFPREESFTEMDKLYVELVAKWVSKMLELEFQKEALIQQNTQLSQLNQQLDGFIYSISHDLKQPVININNMIGLISDNMNEENPIANKALAHLGMAATKLNNTVKDLMEVSRISNTETTSQQIQLASLANEVVQSFKTSISSESWDISIDFEQLPQMHFPLVYLNSILNNIISNAIKYRSPDRILKVALRGLVEEHYDVIECTDNGLGIDAEKYGKKIVGLFKRQHDHVEGSGVGLHIIKRIIDKYNGKLEIESAPDKGFKIKLFFPNK